MRFYNTQHPYYCGIDLHARSMFTHILDSAGATVFERDLPANPDGDRGFRMRRSQPRLPTCRVALELSRCVADHEFVAVSIPRRTLPAKSTPPEFLPSPFGRGAGGEGSSLPFCLACTWHGEVSGALRLQIPLEGVRRQGRRCMGTCSGLTPYSCLVPPRCFHLVMKMPQSGRRCLNHPGAEIDGC